MAFYSDHHGQVNGCSITMENLQEHESKLSQRLHQLALERGIVLDDGPMHSDPYSYGYSHAAPICHICGTHGHTPADCQRGGYSPTPDCFCRHSGNQGTTGRPARAHYNFRKISLRTRLSKPGEVFMLGETSTEIPSRGDHAKGLARPPATPRETSRQGRSVSSTERTWALRPLQSPRYAKAG